MAEEHENDPDFCEVCETIYDGDQEKNRIGCTQCAKMFMPCCNTEDAGLCLECAG